MLVVLMGWSCVAIGLFHFVLGNAAIPGAGSAGTTIDSWGRFMGAAFAGYGLAWLWAARQRPIPAAPVRWLAAVFLLGGIGRLLSLAEHGWPQWFQIVLGALELGLPLVYFVLAGAEERAAAGRVASDGSGLEKRRPGPAVRVADMGSTDR